jgi:HlyD family secretion protein
MKIMKIPRKVFLWSAAAMALALLAWAALREPVQMVSVATVTRASLEQSFVEEGKTRLKQRYVVTAPVAGRVRRISLQPGDAVRAGQVLAEIEPVSASLLDARARSQAQAEVAGSDTALQAARQRVGAAQTSNAVAQKELQRITSLAASGMVTASLLDQTRAQADNAAAALSTARADVQMAQQRLQAAQALQGDEGRAGRDKLLSVTAPVDGVIVKRTQESATPVAVGQVLLEIGNPQALEIEVEVLSSDAVRLKPAGKARVVRWGGEGVLEATITRVEPGGFTKISALGVEEQRTRVILDFASPQQQWAALGDAYRVEVEFIVRQEKDVLQISSNALFRHADGWAVYRVEAGTARRTAMQPGLRAALATQVLGGLEAGQSVIMQPDDRIKDGTRVQAMNAAKNGN